MTHGIKNPNEYVRFRPYKAIGTTRSNWRRGDGPLRSMMRVAVGGVLFIGLPSLVLVPAVVWYLAGFQDWPTFLGHVLATFIFPVGAILLLTLLSGVVAFFRLRFQR